ncbi:MAG TPA: hypothetical protein VN709_03225 [Terriglobales bacterium]|nr:hypothetical protein [Terriglobales bacterium]
MGEAESRLAILSRDTSALMEDRQIARWRALGPQEKFALIAQLCDDVRQLALAGIRDRHPQASERECFLRLTLLTLGPRLARAAYPEIAHASWSESA